MPLIDLRTNLKSLKYGADRLGGGDSGLPYITKDINKANTGLKFDDGLVRGGAVNAAIAGAVDTARIFKFLKDPPKGPLFLVKQVGLQLSNPRLEVPKNPANIASGIPDNLLAVGTNGLLEPTRIYNLGINTLAQVPVNAFGIHFNRHGILPIQTEASKYEAVATANNRWKTASTDIPYNQIGNRLVRLTSKFKLGDREYTSPIGNVSLPGGILAALPLPINLKPQDLIIDDYAAGPNSVYGIGRTTLNRYSNTEDGFKINLQTGFSRQFAGKTRNQNGQVEVVKLKSTEDYEISTLTRSTLSSKTWKYDNTDLNNSFLNPIAKSSDTGSKSQPIGYTVTMGNDLGKGSNSISQYPGSKDEPTAFNQNTIAYSNPSLRKYAELKNQLPTASLYSHTDYQQSSNGKINNLASDYTYSEKTNFTILKPDSKDPKYPSSNLENHIKDTKQSKIDDQISGSIGMKNSSRTSTSSNDVIVGEQLPTSTQSPTYKNKYGEVVTVNIPWNKVTREIRIGSGRRDEINLTPIFEGSNDFGGDTLFKDNDIRDLVRFRIQAVNTDSPNSGQWMVFRAYLTDLSDGADAFWSDVKYAGRGESFYIYTGFTRKINISFKVATLSASEMKFVYQKLNYLMSNTMPDYKDNLMRGPLIRISVGNWIDSQLGILNNINLKVPNDSPWEISLNDQMLVLPHVVEVSMTFTPIGSETAGVNKISEKSMGTSNIAQNNTGDTKTLQYIDVNDSDGTVPQSGDPELDARLRARRYDRKLRVNKSDPRFNQN